MPEKSTDEYLLHRASRGDQTAFLLLYDRYRHSVFRCAYRMLGAIELAEDVVHDCFLSLIKQPRHFDPARASLSTYLYAAARNLALKSFRHRSREDLAENASEQLHSDCTKGPLQNLLDEELSTVVRKAVASLPPLQREALILFEYEGLTLAEVAMIAGTDVGTVKSRIHRAREGMRRRLAPYFKSDARVAAAERFSA